jgi:heme/copper-type cytochrome/quinol oxidase subunit 1
VIFFLTAAFFLGFFYIWGSKMFLPDVHPSPLKIDIYDTYWIIPSKLVIVLAFLMLTYSGIYWLNRDQKLNKYLTVSHCLFSGIGLIGFFSPSGWFMIDALQGLPRRYYSTNEPIEMPSVISINELSNVMIKVGTIGQVFFLMNLAVLWKYRTRSRI